MAETLSTARMLLPSPPLGEGWGEGAFPADTGTTHIGTLSRREDAAPSPRGGGVKAATVVFALALLLFTGCKQGPQAVEPSATGDDGSTPRTAPETPASSEQAASDAEAFAAAVRAGLEAPPAPRRTPPKDPAAAVPEVEWISDAAPPAEDAAPAPAAVAAAPAAPPVPTDGLARALHDLRTGDAPLLQRALAELQLSMALGEDKAAPSLLAQLKPEQRDQLERYRHLVGLLQGTLTTGPGELDRAAINAALDESFGEQPVSIHTVKLCKRVRGFGVYEPFEDHTLLAGREQKVIVYVELENFRSLKRDDGQYEVKLSQELELYNEADGLAVWREPAVAVSDTCRNIRRDFFVVQLVTLPARLTVGKYRLKVRVSDQHGGSIDEVTLPLEVVADEAMVGAAGK